jgi:hypothetical protein
LLKLLGFCQLHHQRHQRHPLHLRLELAQLIPANRNQNNLRYQLRLLRRLCLPFLHFHRLLLQKLPRNARMPGRSTNACQRC